jgi:hypothetical protein
LTKFLFCVGDTEVCHSLPIVLSLKSSGSIAKLTMPSRATGHVALGRLR